MTDDTRTLTDADARAVADALWSRAATDLKMGVGSGILQWVWRSALKVALWLAVAGIAQSAGFLTLNFPQQPPHP